MTPNLIVVSDLSHDKCGKEIAEMKGQGMGGEKKEKKKG